MAALSNGHIHTGTYPNQRLPPTFSPNLPQTTGYSPTQVPSLPQDIYTVHVHAEDHAMGGGQSQPKEFWHQVHAIVLPGVILIAQYPGSTQVHSIFTEVHSLKMSTATAYRLVPLEVR